MSKSSSGGIGIFGILFWGWIIYMVFFSSDDKDDSKVKITINDDPSVTDVLKQSMSDIKTEIEISINAIKKDIVKSMKDVSEDVVEVKKEIKEEVIPSPTEIRVVTEVEPEKKEEALKSLDNKPEPLPTTMKKL